jgi:hypothetical protein
VHIRERDGGYLVVDLGPLDVLFSGGRAVAFRDYRSKAVFVSMSILGHGVAGHLDRYADPGASETRVRIPGEFFDTVILKCLTPRRTCPLCQGQGYLTSKRFNGRQAPAKWLWVFRCRLCSKLKSDLDVARRLSPRGRQKKGDDAAIVPAGDVKGRRK